MGLDELHLALTDLAARGFGSSVCASTAASPPSSHTITAPSDEWGELQVVNTATIVETEQSDRNTVPYTVLCPDGEGCTLTQGYWKTHSDRGPVPYDDTWALLGPPAEDTTFFLSGKTYYGVLWTAPAGNPYYVLAHQYIAATLNILNGASVPADVQAALDAAEAFFLTKTPAQAAALKGAAKNQIIALATTLDRYNNGLIGPGHCSEDRSSA